MRLLTDIDHQQVREEAEASPAFGTKLSRMMDRSDGLRRMDESAMRAVLNELDGKSFPQSKGEWPVLRKRLNTLIRGLSKDIETSISKLSLNEKTRMLESYAHGGVQVHAQMAEYPVEPFGQWTEIATVVIGAAGSLYGAKLQSDTAKELAKIQAAGEARSLDAQMSIAKAQMALQAAQVKSLEQQTAAITAGTSAPGATGTSVRVPGTVASVLTKDIGGGIPLWSIPVGVGALGTILYFVFKG